MQHEQGGTIARGRFQLSVDQIQAHPVRLTQNTAVSVPGRNNAELNTAGRCKARAVSSGGGASLLRLLRGLRSGGSQAPVPPFRGD